MKIGLISDRHGNLHALNAVLNQLDAEGVELILCAGDLVAYGAFPNEVVSRIQERGVPCVMGKYDDAVAWNRTSASNKPSSPSTEPLKQAALEWTQQQFSKAKCPTKSLDWFRKGRAEWKI